MHQLQVQNIYRTCETLEANTTSDSPIILQTAMFIFPPVILAILSLRAPQLHLTHKYMSTISAAKRILARMLHRKARSEYYPRTNNTVKRMEVPDEKVPWEVKWDKYNPPDYTAPHILNQQWADPDITDCNFHPKWNAVDGKINRVSHMGEYMVEGSNPHNPMGRTGLNGRGCLGRWGPNHAADPIVTRWKRNDSGEKISHPRSTQPILQFVAIQRRDTGEWAIPGGMVDAGEMVTSTLKREFMEEALNILESDSIQKEKSEAMVEKFFSKGEEVYRGYVDDHRNTDSAWIETVAMNFHDESGTSVGALTLCAGDDAAKVRWMDIDRGLSLYASHNDFIAKVVEKHNSHW